MNVVRESYEEAVQRVAERALAHRTPEERQAVIDVLTTRPASPDVPTITSDTVDLRMGYGYHNDSLYPRIVNGLGIWQMADRVPYLMYQGANRKTARRIHRKCFKNRRNKPVVEGVHAPGRERRQRNANGL
jgi:hypothetical protein